MAADEQFAHLKPAMLAILVAIEEVFVHGDECLDLGSGAVQYKLRFADGDYPVCWRVLMVPSLRLPLTFASMVPTFTSRWTRDTAKRVLGPKGSVACAICADDWEVEIQVLMFPS